VKSYFKRVFDAHAEVQRADERVERASNETEFEQLNAEAWDAVDRRRDAILNRRPR
jgi:hypothetical protein